MSETGVVVGLHGDQAFVEMEASKDCEACGACRYTKTGRMVATVTNSLNARIGDAVKIDIEPQMVLVAAFIVYIFPIAAFFVGYTLGLWTGRLLGLPADRLGLAGGAAFLIVSYFAVRAIDKRAGLSRRFEPKMYDIIRNSNPPGGI